MRSENRKIIEKYRENEEKNTNWGIIKVDECLFVSIQREFPFQKKNEKMRKSHQRRRWRNGGTDLFGDHWHLWWKKREEMMRGSLSSRCERELKNETYFQSQISRRKVSEISNQKFFQKLAKKRLRKWWGEGWLAIQTRFQANIISLSRLRHWRWKSTLEYLWMALASFDFRGRRFKIHSFEISRQNFNRSRPS